MNLKVMKYIKIRGVICGKAEIKRVSSIEEGKEVIRSEKEKLGEETYNKFLYSVEEV